MFKKVLVAEDFGSINTGVLSTLRNLDIPNIDTVQYCDDAYLKIKSAVNQDAPYDLFISDLSFKVDYRSQRFSSGEVLISTLHKEHPELKITVFSVEERFQKVRTLVMSHGVAAYVCKGRDGLKELSSAIGAVFEGKQFLSPQVERALNEKEELDVADYDIELIKQLSNGLSQEEISIYFKEHQISPSSLSSVEKRLNSLKIQFKANNATHLVAIVKDLGLI